MHFQAVARFEDRQPVLQHLGKIGSLHSGAARLFAGGAHAQDVLAQILVRLCGYLHQVVERPLHLRHLIRAVGGCHLARKRICRELRVGDSRQAILDGLRLHADIGQHLAQVVVQFAPDAFALLDGGQLALPVGHLAGALCHHALQVLFVFGNALNHAVKGARDQPNFILKMHRHLRFQAPGFHGLHAVHQSIQGFHQRKADKQGDPQQHEQAGAHHQVSQGQHLPVQVLAALHRLIDQHAGGRHEHGGGLSGRRPKIEKGGVAAPVARLYPAAAAAADTHLVVVHLESAIREQRQLHQGGLASLRLYLPGDQQGLVGGGTPGGAASLRRAHKYLRAGPFCKLRRIEEGNCRQQVVHAGAERALGKSRLSLAIDPQFLSVHTEKGKFHCQGFIQVLQRLSQVRVESIRQGGHRIGGAVRPPARQRLEAKGAPGSRLVMRVKDRFPGWLDQDTHQADHQRQGEQRNGRQAHHKRSGLRRTVEISHADHKQGDKHAQRGHKIVRQVLQGGVAELQRL